MFLRSSVWLSCLISDQFRIESRVSAIVLRDWQETAPKEEESPTNRLGNMHNCTSRCTIKSFRVESFGFGDWGLGFRDNFTRSRDLEAEVCMFQIF